MTDNRGPNLTIMSPGVMGRVRPGIEVIVSPDRPMDPGVGWLWWDTRDGQLYVWTGRHWVAASCCDDKDGTSIGVSPPIDPNTGNLWWDSREGQLYIWTGSEWVAASCCDTTGSIVSSFPPDNPRHGMLWWDSREGQLYVWTGEQWVAASCCDSNDGAAALIGDTAPIPPAPGGLWWDSSDGQLFVWTGSEWVVANCCGDTTTVSATAPDDPTPGQLWVQPDGSVWVWNGSIWLQLGLAPIPPNTILGNNTGDTALPQALTVAQIAAMIGVFTQTANGLVPAPGSGTPAAYVLQADGHWVPQTGGGGGGTVLTDATLQGNGTTTTPLGTAVAPNDTIMGNVSGAAAQPVAITPTQLAGLIGTFPTTQPGLVPAVPPGTPATDVLTPAGWAAPQSLVVTIQRFNSTTATLYTAPPGLQSVIVECFGGGGGGGAALANGSVGGGGGGGTGGYSRKALTAAQVGASQPITVGAGGAGSTGTGTGTGGLGGTTAFGPAAAPLCGAIGGGGGGDWDGTVTNRGIPGGGAILQGPQTAGDLFQGGNAGHGAVVAPLGTTFPTSGYIVYPSQGATIWAGQQGSGALGPNTSNAGPGAGGAGDANGYGYGGVGAFTNAHTTGAGAGTWYGGGPGAMGGIIVTEFSLV